ncbi:MAG TPA: BON domain-containing protein [Gemmatimonadales bacterium]|jgi:osmotically-inducible protein OsmY
MRRLSVRRSNAARDATLGAAGLGLGLVAGFILRGFVGGMDRRRIRTLVGEMTGQHRVPFAMPRQDAIRITAALGDDPLLGGIEFEVVTVRIGQVELHGWVPSRAASARAMRLARSAAPDTEVTNRLKVRGEDDHPGGAGADEEERQPA